MRLVLFVLSVASLRAVAYFGLGVAAGDGVVAVGAPFDGNGAVYVYENGGRVRVENPGKEVRDWFGGAVAFSGGVLIVGAHGAENNRGAVYVFVREGGAWKQAQRFTPPEVFEGFGAALAASGDTVAVGADGVNGSTGAVYVYARAGGVLKLQARLAASDGAKGDNFGAALALEKDTLVIGAYHKRKVADDRATTDAGAAYVFVRSGGVWRERARLLSPGGRPFYEFGSAVGVSGDAVFIGEHRRELEPGGVHVFVRAGDVWNHKLVLRARDSGKGDAFGMGIAAEAGTLLVGAWHKDSHLGAAYVFAGQGGEWREMRKLVAPDRGLQAPERFGQTVAVRGDVWVVGAPERNQTAGAAYVVRGGGGVAALAH